MSDDDKVRRLPVRFQKPACEEGRTLKIVETRFVKGECDHIYQGSTLNHVTYLIRNGETEIECGGCGTRLDPMFVLTLMARAETDWLRTRAAYQEEMKRLNERKLTKCQHCRKMTRISRAKP